jgi:Protein of unknown function (DUF2867)
VVRPEIRDPEGSADQSLEIAFAASRIYSGRGPEIRRFLDLRKWEFGMHVIECDVPSGSALSRELIGNAHFHDAYRAPLARPELGIVDIFFALFGHTPLWMKLTLIVRNAAASLAGLEVPTVAEIMRPKIRESYSVGDKIGPWPIFFIGDNEIVAGRDNRHMDFRLSVLKAMDGDAMSVVVSTICTVHNVFGKIYLFFIIPFHRHGVRSLMSNAVVAKRL